MKKQNLFLVISMIFVLFLFSTGCGGTPTTPITVGQIQLTSPSNGATLPPGDITFSWNPVSNATKYQFILYNSQGQVALDAIYSGTSSIVELGIEETITWKVRAGDNSNNWGAWSNIWSLTIKSTPLVAVGDSYGGGKVAYILQSGDTGYISGQTHGLIAATEDQSTGIAWSNITSTLVGTDRAYGTGAANTTKIIAQAGHSSSAAKICADYTVTVNSVTYDDWFLPSTDELDKLYHNKVTIGGFAGSYYWSSSEVGFASPEMDATNASCQTFYAGGVGFGSKGSNLRVRAVRDF